MSLLEYLPSVRPSVADLDELEDIFVAWMLAPAKPDVVDLRRNRQISMVELSRRLGASPSPLPAAACVQIGLPAGVTIATAVAELLHATVDPDGPRCRSFRAGMFYLRGLALLEADLAVFPDHLDFPTEDPTGHPTGHTDVR